MLYPINKLKGRSTLHLHKPCVFVVNIIVKTFIFFNIQVSLQTNQNEFTVKYANLTTDSRSIERRVHIVFNMS